VPILHGAVGPYSVLAMAVVCALAYAVGNAVRFNIRTAEPLLENGTASRRTIDLERTSDLALVAAYVISVCLYINILASFLLNGLGAQYDTPRNEHLLTVSIIAVIGIVGYTKGLDVLQKLESVGLWVTLVIVAALFVGFGAFDVSAASAGIQWPKMPERSVWQIITIVSGTLIVVQGFETSRYLGEQFDTETRIRSCRLSQVISTVVYLAFVALATPLMHFLGDKVQDNGLIMLAGKASPLLVIPLIVAAVLSQFSAAVADTMAGGGNMVEATHDHVDAKHAYLLICGGAILLAFSSTLTILALASRAFAFYYLLQCLVAVSVSKSASQRLFFRAIAIVLGFITVFSVPAG